MAKLAFLGLGVMGAPMAGHLQKAGHEVTVYNRTGAKAEAWVAEYGGASAATPREAAEGAEMVMACVGNDNDLRSVCLGDDGAFAGMSAGTIFVDHTTVSAAVTREFIEDRYEALPRDYEGPRGAEDRDYTWDYFADLPAFFERAEKAGRHVIFTVDQ